MIISTIINKLFYLAIIYHLFVRQWPYGDESQTYLDIFLILVIIFDQYHKHKNRILNLFNYIRR